MNEFCGDEVSEKSLPMITSRVMETVAQMSDGVLETDSLDDSTKVLVGESEEILDAKQPLHRTREDNEGNTVVIPE